jgi:allophanate hydrolase subunit 2
VGIQDSARHIGHIIIGHIITCADQRGRGIATAVGTTQVFPNRKAFNLLCDKHRVGCYITLKVVFEKNIVIMGTISSFLRDRVFLCSPGWPRTYDPRASASQVLEL